MLKRSILLTKVERCTCRCCTTEIESAGRGALLRRCTKIEATGSCTGATGRWITTCTKCKHAWCRCSLTRCTSAEWVGIWLRLLAGPAKWICSLLCTSATKYTLRLLWCTSPKWVWRSTGASAATCSTKWAWSSLGACTKWLCCSGGTAKYGLRLLRLTFCCLTKYARLLRWCSSCCTTKWWWVSLCWCSCCSTSKRWWVDSLMCVLCTKCEWTACWLGRCASKLECIWCLWLLLVTAACRACCTELKTTWFCAGVSST